MSFEPMLNAGGWPLVVLIAVALAGALAWSGYWLLRADADPGSRWTWGRRAALAMVTVLILSGPSVPVTETRPMSNIEIYLVVDRTGSMAEEDWAGGPDNGGGTRLDGVRQDLTAIRDAFPAARFSIIALDSAAARELPLTSDFDAVTSWINSLQQEPTTKSSGSSLERALPQLTQDLKSSSENTPEAARIVYILSDGEATDDGVGASEAKAAGVSWSQLSAVVDGGAVLGYGTPEGAHMREFEVGQTTAPDDEPKYITEPGTSQPAVSVPDTKELQTVASDMGLPYFQRTGGSDDVPTKDFTDVNVQEVFSDGRERSNRYTYFTWPLGLAAAVLLIWELAALVRADRAAAHVTRPAADTGPSGDAAGASGGSARGAAGAAGAAGAPGGSARGTAGAAGAVGAPGGSARGTAGAAGAVGAPGGDGSMPIPVAAVPGGAVPGAVPGGAVPGSAVPGYGGSRGVPGSGAPMGGMR